MVMRDRLCVTINHISHCALDLISSVCPIFNSFCHHCTQLCREFPDVTLRVSHMQNCVNS